MAFEVSDSTIKSTTKCQYDFECMKGGNRPACQVDRKIERNGLFLSDTKHDECNYKMSFGSRYICHCPVRIEFYHRYVQ